MAFEQGNEAEFELKYQAALKTFAESRALHTDPANIGLAATEAGTNLLFADRLPAKYRAAAWATAYADYHEIWEQQKEMVAKLPLHIKGELLSGLAQAAQRNGRMAEMNEHLDRILEFLPGTPYEASAKKWKADPAVASKVKIACMSCHDPGRLEPSLARAAKR